MIHSTYRICPLLLKAAGSLKFVRVRICAQKVLTTTYHDLPFGGFFLQISNGKKVKMISKHVWVRLNYTKSDNTQSIHRVASISTD